MENEIGIKNTTAQPQGSEGEWVVTVGWCIAALSVLASFICIIAYGKVEVPHDYGYGLITKSDQWSPLIVGIYLGSGLSGAFFGYALAKIGSVLRHLEAIRAKG